MEKVVNRAKIIWQKRAFGPGEQEQRDMTKHDFLERLQSALNGKLSPELVKENIRYYEDYVNTEIRKGRDEEEILNELGDPRLIARTIVETGGGSSTGYEEYTGGGNGRASERDGEYGLHGRRTEVPSGRFVSMPVWVWLVIALVVVVVVLGVVFSVIAAILRIVLPVLIPILVVLFLIKLFRDWLN